MLKYKSIVPFIVALLLMSYQAQAQSPSENKSGTTQPSECVVVDEATTAEEELPEVVVPTTPAAHAPGATQLSSDTGVCPTNRGSAVTTRKEPIKSVSRVYQVPTPRTSVPKTDDKVITPAPSDGKTPISVPVPQVTPSPIPDAALKPISLDQALQIAFRNNPDFRIALDQIEKSRGSVAEARARFNPAFNLQLTSTEQGPTESFSLGEGKTPVQLVAPNTSTGTVSILLPLDISRKLTYASDISRYQFQAQYLSMLSTSEALILSVKTAYYNLMRACAQQSVAQAAVDVAQERLKNTETRQRAGTVPVFDLRSAQVDLANLNQSLIQAQNQVFLAQAAMNAVLGIDVNNPTQAIGMTVPVSTESIDIPSAVDQAYARRPEVKVAQSAITINETNVKLAKTGSLPSLNLSGGSTYNFNAAGLNPASVTWSLSLSLSAPLWDGGVTKAKVREARADVQNSVDALSQTKLAVAQQVRNAGLSLQESATRTKTTADAVGLAEEALRLANVRYEAGIATPVEVTNAESQLTQARANHVNAQYDYAVALAQVQRATSSQPELDRLQLLKSSAEQNR